MQDTIVTVSCPLSYLQTIYNALDWAQNRSRFRAEIINNLVARHEEDSSIAPYYIETVDDVKHLEQDAAQFEEAYNLAWKLYVNSKDTGLEWTNAEEPQVACDFASEFVPF